MRTDAWRPRLVGAARQILITLALPAPQVRAMLPVGLDLAEQPATPPSLHPVGLAFGHNWGVRMTGLSLFDLDYLESSVSIPFVRHLNAARLTYTPRLYLDNICSVVGGALVWGFAKELAHLRWGTRTFEVSSPVLDERIMTLEFESKGPFLPPTAYPNFETVWPVMCQPKVEKTLLGYGPYVFSRLDWGRHTMEIRPVEAWLTVKRQFLPGLPPGEYRSRGIDATPMGAFEFRTDRWWLSLPCATQPGGTLRASRSGDSTGSTELRIDDARHSGLR